MLRRRSPRWYATRVLSSFPLEGNPLAPPLICRSVRDARVSSPLLRFGSISLDNIDELSTPIELGASQARGITTEG